MNTHNIPFLNLKKKIILNYPKSASMGFFQGTQERVRNNRGKRAISVRAIGVLLYVQLDCDGTTINGYVHILVAIFKNGVSFSRIVVTSLLGESFLQVFFFFFFAKWYDFVLCRAKSRIWYAGWGRGRGGGGQRISFKIAFLGERRKTV